MQDDVNEYKTTLAASEELLQEEYNLYNSMNQDYEGLSVEDMQQSWFVFLATLNSMGFNS